MTSDDVDHLIVAFAVVALVVIGFAAGVMAAGDSEPSPKSAPEPSVSCSAFLTEEGEASAICLIVGDVRFEWLGENSTTFYAGADSGNVNLSGLPAGNYTARIEP